VLVQGENAMVESVASRIAQAAGGYTCPMHPQIVRTEPGNCPICGMALEPRTGTAEEENAELIDMRRRFWISTALAIPVFLMAMAADLLPGFAPQRISFSGSSSIPL
jgi:Cu+-exporting ATPase